MEMCVDRGVYVGFVNLKILIIKGIYVGVYKRDVVGLLFKLSCVYLYIYIYERIYVYVYLFCR